MFRIRAMQTHDAGALSQLLLPLLPPRMLYDDTIRQPTAPFFAATTVYFRATFTAATLATILLLRHLCC